MSSHSIDYGHIKTRLLWFFLRPVNHIGQTPQQQEEKDEGGGGGEEEEEEEEES